jgi:hypothetical protein
MNINDLMYDKIIDSDINKILGALVDNNILTKYNYNIVPYYNWNEIRVYLNLESRYMVKPITICPVVNVKYGEE